MALVQDLLVSPSTLRSLIDHTVVISRLVVLMGSNQPSVHAPNPQSFTQYANTSINLGFKSVDADDSEEFAVLELQICRADADVAKLGWVYMLQKFLSIIPTLLKPQTDVGVCILCVKFYGSVANTLGWSLPRNTTNLDITTVRSIRLPARSQTPFEEPSVNELKAH